MSKIEYPGKRVPEDSVAGKLLGLYKQIQEGVWLQRVKVPGGLLSGRQWRRLGEMSRRFSEEPLRLTTRQDIEIHGLSEGEVPKLQEELFRAGLDVVGACGDTLRNITVCPCSGMLGERPGLDGLAERVRRRLGNLEGIFSLPRKFKVSFSCDGDGCGGQPWINDLAFIAGKREGQWGFRVLAGGSLGKKASLAIEVFEWLEPESVIGLSVAAVKMFELYGDRENRNRARLRHVRERLGNERFVVELQEQLRLVGSAGGEPVGEGEDESDEIVSNQDGFKEYVVLNFLNGELVAEAAVELGELAEQEGRAVRIGNLHQVYVFGDSEAEIYGDIERYPALRGEARQKLHITVCPGKRYCRRALTDTAEIAERLGQELAGKVEGVSICISGCPNGCGHSGVGQIGLIGKLKSFEGEKRQVYDLLVDGGMGRNERLGRLVGRKLSDKELILAIKDHLGIGQS